MSVPKLSASRAGEKGQTSGRGNSIARNIFPATVSAD
jgi:hypothetical protein